MTTSNHYIRDSLIGAMLPLQIVWGESNLAIDWQDLVAWANDDYRLKESATIEVGRDGYMHGREQMFVCVHRANREAYYDISCDSPSGKRLLRLLCSYQWRIWWQSTLSYIGESHGHREYFSDTFYFHSSTLSDLGVETANFDPLPKTAAEVAEREQAAKEVAF